jgi:hypothetical protein
LQVEKKNWSQGQTARHNFGREPSNDYFIKILFLLSKWFWPIMQIRKKGGWNFKKIFSSETTEPISTKLCWNDSWVVLFQNCVRHFRTPTKMATTAWKKGKNSMGNQIYFKIAGKKKKLIAGSNRQTHFWKRTIQWLFHQNHVKIFLPCNCEATLLQNVK